MDPGLEKMVYITSFVFQKLFHEFLETTLREIVKLRPLVKSNQLSSNKYHQFYEHQKKVSKKAYDIRKLSFLLNIMKSSLCVTGDIILDQYFILKMNRWSHESKCVWNIQDNPVSLSFHELWQASNVTPQNH